MSKPNKTLKDFYNIKYSAQARELRAEAVKWVKEDKVRISKMTKNYQTPSRIILRKWMHRFNLTEEDLK